jgi:hypothetical protein
VLICCWSVKGGVGTSVVATALGLVAAARDAGPALLVDLAGDLPLCLGVVPPDGPGVAEWLDAGAAAPPDALGRLETRVAPGLGLLHRGRGPLAAEPAGLLVQLLAASGRTVVVDGGRIEHDGAAERIAAEADRSLLVTRLCLLALDHVRDAHVRPSGVVVVREAGRSLGLADVQRMVRAPVVADVAVDPRVARAVDTGLLGARLPRAFADALRGAA